MSKLYWSMDRHFCTGHTMRIRRSTSKTGSGRAVYGVTSILISALDSEKPSHAMVAWDLPNQPFVMLSMGYRQRPKARRDGRADHHLRRK